MSDAWDPDDDELGDILNQAVNWPAGDDGTAPVVELSDEYAQRVFAAAYDFGVFDEQYGALLDEEALAMRSADTSGTAHFAFGDAELSAEGEFGPDGLTIGAVTPAGVATVRVEAISGAQTVEADDLGRFELVIADRVLRIVVTRGSAVRSSDWLAR